MMTKNMRKNLKTGRRYRYTEGRVTDLLLEISKPAFDEWDGSIVNIRILFKKKDLTGSYSIGKTEFDVDQGTWKYLEGQDKPITVKKRQLLRKGNF